MDEVEKGGEKDSGNLCEYIKWWEQLRGYAM
jgi:hypothetical protein